MPKEPDPGYIRMDPDDGHSVSFPDTSKGTDSPVEFAAHAFGVPTWGVEAANAIIDAATGALSFADGGLVGDDHTITRDAEDPEAAQRAIDALRGNKRPPSRRRTSTQAARRRLQQQTPQPERRQVKVMLPKPPPGHTGYYKITRK